MVGSEADHPPGFVIVNDFWIDILKYVITAGIGGIIAIWVARSQKTQAERSVEIIQKLLTATDLSVEQYVEKLEQTIKLDDEVTKLQGEVKVLTDRANKAEKGSEERQRHIDELEKKVANDLQETQRIRAEYASALKQIIGLEDLAIGLGELLDKIARQAGITLTDEGRLMQSVLRLKREREERQKRS